MMANIWRGMVQDEIITKVSVLHCKHNLILMTCQVVSLTALQILTTLVGGGDNMQSWNFTTSTWEMIHSTKRRYLTPKVNLYGQKNPPPHQIEVNGII